MIAYPNSSDPVEVPLCNRTDFVLDQVRGRSVVSIGLGGQPQDAAYSFDLRSDDLSATFSARLADAAASMTVFDISELAIAAFEGVIDADLRLVDICADPSSWAAEVQSLRVERVVLGEVLEHLDNPGGALRSLATLLAPGGKMVVTVPNGFCLSVVARMARGEEAVHPEHLAYYSPSTLTRLLGTAGLRVTELGFYRTRPLHRSQFRDSPLGYVSGVVAERLPQLARGLVAVAEVA